MLINRLNLSVSALASRDETRLNLAGVYLEPDGTTAADGHCLGHVTLPQYAKAEDYPAVPGVEATDDALVPCIIPTEAATRISKAIPKKTKLPILENALVDVASSNQNGTCRVVTTDLEDPANVLECRKIAMDFPAWRQIMPQGEPAFSIGFNAELLARVLKVAGQFQGKSHAVRLEFFERINPETKERELDATGPMRITAANPETGQDGTFLVMPLAFPTERGAA